MSIERMPIKQFVAELEAAYERKDGYIMGSRGQNPKKWAKDSWWFTQYSGSQKTKALYWREHAERVWDCNGMSEGIYEDFSGVNINTKARFNYAQWCDPKGTGMIPTEYRVPGAAVFWGDSASSIHHVGYLYKPVEEGNTSGDWYIIEARGVMYGVVKTKLLSRKPNYWGWMTKYYDYDSTATVTERILRKGMSGEDVKEMQEGLIKLGFDLGKYGADGDFGSATETALEAFQAKYALEEDGLYGADTRRVMAEELAKLTENPTEETQPEAETSADPANQYTVTGGSVYLWTAPPAMGGSKSRTVHKDEKLDKADVGDYVPVKIDEVGYWINSKYVK